MEILGERPLWSMSDSEKLSALDAVVAEKARLETLELHLIADLDQSGYATDLGAADTARLLSKRYRIDAAEARREVRIATRLTKYAATAAALPDPSVPFADPAAAGPAPDATGGEDLATAGWRVHPAQAEAIVSVLAQVPSTVAVEHIDFAEQRLIDLAATHTPLELRRAGRKIRDILDPDGPEPDEKAAYASESLTMKTADRGVTFRGYLAGENAELLRTLIHAHAKPHKTIDGEHDPRPRDKRQADALTTILNTSANAHHLATGTPAQAQDSAGAGAEAEAKSDVDAGALVNVAAASDEGREVLAGYGPKAQISVTIDFNDLVAATANATGSLVFGDDLSAATVRRLACDAEILPIVLGSKSQPLDVGTSQRLVTRPIRRALNARDKGCVICKAPPIQCEAHHIIHWARGGPTAISNLVLLCKRDHLDLHSGHWRIRVLDGIVQVTRPTWANPDRIPPGRYKPPTANIVHKPTNVATFDPWADGELDAPTTDIRPPTPAQSAESPRFDPWGDDAQSLG
jgi:hypothetical protein